MNKQIEEMAKTYDEARYKATETIGSMNEGAGKWYAKAFYNAGYRRASDVAREIVNDVKETLLDFHLREDKKYSASKTKKRKQFDIETARYRAITDAIKFAIEALNEVEKKYESEGGE